MLKKELIEERINAEFNIEEQRLAIEKHKKKIKYSKGVLNAVMWMLKTLESPAGEGEEDGNKEEDNEGVGE